MKSLLVIDTPKDCGECRLNSHTEYDFDVCWVTQGKGGCPLRPLPERKKFIKHGDSCDDGFYTGFNSCLDEILGDSK